MHKFLKKIFLFLSPIALLFLILFSLINKLNKNDTDSFKLNRNIKTIVVGDSRVQYAIDDFTLKNTKNVAINSEGFMYSYEKIKYLIANNPKIEAIYLGASYHSFSEYFDQYTFNGQVASRCFFYMPTSDQLKITWEVESPLHFLTLNLKTELKKISKGKKENNWLGFYTNYITTLKVNNEFIKNRIQSQYFLEQQERGFSETQIIYFNKIIRYCRDKNKTLVILNTPMHKNYKEKVPMKFKNKFYQIINANNLELIEFDDLTIEDTGFLPDGDHVTETGAILVTEYLKNH